MDLNDSNENVSRWMPICVILSVAAKRIDDLYTELLHVDGIIESLRNENKKLKTQRRAMLLFKGDVNE